MPKIVYVRYDGERTEIDVEAGTSIMQGAVSNGVDGIVGECGGSAMCATCHVYVDTAFLKILPPMSAAEDELLDGAASKRFPSSRLSCQISMNEELDGILVRLPETQI